MIEFKKATKSCIDSNNWLYLAHHTFKIFSLNDNEIVYVEEEPFRKKYNQISNVLFSQDNSLVVLVSFKGDFAIYGINHSTKKIVKEHLYIQKGDYYCGDVGPVWVERNCITIRIENKKKCILRSIFFNGKIRDLNCSSFVHYFNNQSSFNELLFQEGDKDRKYLGYLMYDDIALKTITNSLRNKRIDNLRVSIFTNEDFSKNVLAINESQNIRYYTWDLIPSLIKNYRKENKNSSVLDVFSKIVNESVITVEVIYKEYSFDTFYKEFSFMNDFPQCSIRYVSRFVFDDGEKRIFRNFDEKFIKKHKLLHLSAFNSSFVSFVSEKNSIVVMPIYED